jgi:hypothetical protein
MDSKFPPPTTDSPDLPPNRSIPSIHEEREERESPPATVKDWMQSVADRIHQQYHTLRTMTTADQYESVLTAGKMIALTDVHEILSHVIKTEPWSLNADINPPEMGRYLLLCHQWYGKADGNIAEPRWEIMLWNGFAWEMTRKCVPAEGYQPNENHDRFKPVRWQRLPSQ